MGKANRTPLVSVYVIKETETDFIVRVKTAVEDTCLCVCNGQWEADVIVALVKAAAWNMTSQAAQRTAEKKLTEFLKP